MVTGQRINIGHQLLFPFRHGGLWSFHERAHPLTQSLQFKTELMIAVAAQNEVLQFAVHFNIFLQD